MKRIRLKILGFGSMPLSENFIYQFLAEKYEVILCDDPDYILCSLFSPIYEYCGENDKAIRIFFSGENFAPDFNLVDYAIGMDNISFNDRYFRYSVAYDTRLDKVDRNYSGAILKEKTYFANFIAGHESEFGYRGDFFKHLCSYKRVESPGKYLNNMPNGEKVNRSQKLAFQRKCKFTLCFESTSYPDFCTEKIADAFLADTIPVYYGDPNVTQYFNPKAFIHCNELNFEEAINKIIELDNDDSKYLAMLREPIFVTENFASHQEEEFKKWLYHIFEQPLEKARRRTCVYIPKLYNDTLYKVFKREERNNRIRRKIKKVTHNRLTRYIKRKIFPAKKM